MPAHPQPRELTILTYGEFWDRFSFFGTLTILVLFLTQIAHFSIDRSDTLYGIYTELSFSLPILGGIIADRVLGLKQAIIIGFILYILGYLALAFLPVHLFFVGICLSLTGLALYKVNNTAMLGLFYEENDPQRVRGFTLYYAIMNVGAMLSPVVMGLLMKQQGWRIGFLISALGLSSGLLYFLISFRKSKCNISDNKGTHCNRLAAYTGILIFPFLLLYAFYYPTSFNFIFLAIIISAAAYLIVISLKLDIAARKEIIGLLILCLFSSLFFAGSLQVGSSITLFINADVIHLANLKWIPAQTYSALDPLFVALSFPLINLAWKKLSEHNREPSMPNKMAIGLVLCATGLYLFMLTAHIDAQQHALILTTIIIAYLFLGAGEICLAPAILSAISEYAPQALKSTLMGTAFLFIAFGGYLSTLYAKFAPHSQGNKFLYHNPLLTVHAFGSAFLEMASLTLAAGILLVLLSQWINKLIKT